jgi:predicted lipid carrier protein YhbT
LKNGILTGVSKNGLVPECGYDTDISTFKAVVSGTCPPQKAFFEGRGEIFGDVEKGLQVITALGAFFTRYPYDPEHRGK